jgi:hemerythrin-like domain-containing protein
MNTAAKNLEDDHVHILRLTDVMEKITLNGSEDTGHIEKIVDLIRDFADGLHHAKEENLYFPFLSNKGFSQEQGPVAVMLHEHIQGRDYVKGIADNLALFRQGDKNAITAVYYNMNGYAQLLRNHIAKENNILFRMADRVLSDSDNTILLKNFAEAEKAHYSKRAGRNYISEINELAAVYGI